MDAAIVEARKVGPLLDQPITIEVGLNESVSKDKHRGVAYGVDEVVRDAVACAQAGAAMIHFHARNDDGSQAWSDAGIYRCVMEAIAAQTDVITYPSYLADHSHIWDLVDRPPVGAPLLIASFDVVQELKEAIAWDKAGKQFTSLGYDGMFDPNVRPAVLQQIRDAGLMPVIAAFDSRDIRWTVLALEAGLLDPPVDLKLFLCEKFVVGPEPSVANLDMMLAQIPAGADIECTVVPLTSTDPVMCEQLWRAAIDRGCNIRVGIGDTPGAFPDATNVHLVARAVEMIKEAGKRPASPAEVRERLHLPRPATAQLGTAQPGI
jgi:3-keto-5-aminohexanoate cleavage enzyme